MRCVRVLFVAFLLLLLAVAAVAQTPSTGSVTISGSLQGPICVNGTCGIYDSGQIQITVTSKATGTTANYPLSTSVTHSGYFAKASFTATPSGPTLTGGTGGPSPIGTLLQQLSNDTSSCSSANDPGGNLPYCFALFNGFNTSANNSG